MANKKIYADLPAAAALVAADLVCTVVNISTTPTTKSATVQKILDLTFGFTIIQCPAGTSPTADQASDTLTITTASGKMTATGNSGTDTIDFDVPGLVTGAVDNAILRADGVGGSTLQSSVVLINDSTGTIHQADTSANAKPQETRIQGINNTGAGAAADAGDLVLQGGDATAQYGGQVVLSSYTGGKTVRIGTNSSTTIQIYPSLSDVLPQYSANVDGHTSARGFGGGIYYGMKVNAASIQFFTDNSSTIRATIAADGIYLPGYYQSGLGTVGAPSHSFITDSNTGMYSPSADVLALATAGTKRLDIGSTGKTTHQIGGTATLGGIGAIATYYSTTQTGNTAATETDAFSHTVAANTLNASGESLTFRAGGTFAAGANQRIKVKLGGATVFDTGVMTVASANSWELEGEFIRTGAATGKVVIKMNSSFATLAAYAAYTAITEDWTTGLTLKLTIDGTGASATVAEMYKEQFHFAP